MSVVDCLGATGTQEFDANPSYITGSAALRKILADNQVHRGRRHKISCASVGDLKLKFDAPMIIIECLTNRPSEVPRFVVASGWSVRAVSVRIFRDPTALYSILHGKGVPRRITIASCASSCSPRAQWVDGRFLPQAAYATPDADCLVQPVRLALARSWGPRGPHHWDIASSSSTLGPLLQQCLFRDARINETARPTYVSLRG